jgi:hypothetical protein
MVYFKNICLILTVIFLKICNFFNGHIFKNFEAKCCQNAEREREREKRKEKMLREKK